MKKLNYQEFQKRLIEVNHARRIFNNLTGDQIDKSFAVYQEILASEPMDVMITSTKTGRMPGAKVCPECSMRMDLMGGVSDEEGNKWPSAWFCSACFLILYNDKTINEAMMEV